MELCTHLSYMRSISPGKAVFYYKRPECEFVPLEIQTSKIRGQKCSYSEGFRENLQPRKLQQHDLAYANPLTIEICYVPADVNEIYCRFTLRIEANSLRPYVCGDPHVLNTLTELALEYKKHDGYKELAKRYSTNLLMGSWLWRNRFTQSTQLEIKTSLNSTYRILDSRELNWSEAWPESEQRQREQLEREIETALSEPGVFWGADVIATLQTSFCQEIYPSQKFIEKTLDYSIASRQLATTECSNGKQAACITAQKIGAALQRIDDWWSADADYPLRVHEYGAEPERLTARRHPVSGHDFYHLLTKADIFLNDFKSKKMKKISGDIHFLMSVLVKGGLFQKGRGA